jgi:hypothetical protein
MVSTDLLWEFGKEPPSGWQGNGKSPTFNIDMFLVIKIEVGNHGHLPTLLRVPASSRRTPVVLSINDYAHLSSI